MEKRKGLFHLKKTTCLAGGHVLKALPIFVGMSRYKKLSHVIYKCDYHIVWVPKYRLRILKGQIKELLANDIRKLCEWKGCEVSKFQN